MTILTMPVGEMPAGRELDELIAQRVTGWPKPDATSCELLENACWALATDNRGFDCWRYRGPRYSTEIADAWDVVEATIYPKGWFLAPMPDTGGWWGVFRWEFIEGRDFGGGQYEVAIGETAPLAICRAALTEVMAQ